MKDFKKKMREKIKIYSNEQYLDGYIQDEFLTDDEEADIFLKLSDSNQLFDSRTINKQVDLVQDIYEFIEMKTSMLENDIKIRLHIIGLNLPSKEQEAVRHILKEHYAIELYKIQKEYIQYRNKIFKLIGVGILSLLGYAFFYFHTTFDFFLEVLGFFFTFSLWEAFDCFIYTFSDVKKEREAITQNLLMDIDFEDKKRICNISFLVFIKVYNCFDIFF